MDWLIEIGLRTHAASDGGRERVEIREVEPGHVHVDEAEGVLEDIDARPVGRPESPQGQAGKAHAMKRIRE